MRVITAAGMAARCELAKISKKLHADCRNYLVGVLRYLHLAENIFTARKLNLGQGFHRCLFVHEGVYLWV